MLHVCVEGPVNADTGFVQDFADISAVVKPLIERLDHRHLGTYLGNVVRPEWRPEGMPYDFYPTSENLLWWIADHVYALDIYRLERDSGIVETITKIRPGSIVPINDGDTLLRASYWSKLSIEETCTSMATLTRKEYDDAKGLRRYEEEV